MPSSRFALVPPHPAEILLPLVDLDEPKFQQLLKATRQQDAFGVLNNRDETLSKEIGVEASTLYYLLPLLGSLYQGTRTIESNQERRSALDSFLKAYLGEVDDPNSNAARDKLLRRLTILLERNPEADRALKTQRLKAGFVPNATGFSTLVDLRPDFDEKRVSIQALLPVVQLRITTDSEIGFEKRLIVQLSTEMLSSLRLALDDVEKKIATASKHAILNR